MIGLLGVLVACGVGFIWLVTSVRARLVITGPKNDLEHRTRCGLARGGGGGSGTKPRCGVTTATRRYRHLIYPDCPPKRFQNRTSEVVEVEVNYQDVWEVPPGEVMTINVPIRCVEFRIHGQAIDRFDNGKLPDVAGTWIVCPPVPGLPQYARFSVTYLEGERGDASDFECPHEPPHPVLAFPRPTAPPPASRFRLPPPPTPLECPYHRPHPPVPPHPPTPPEPIPPVPPLPPEPPMPPALRTFVVHVAFDKSMCPAENRLSSVKVRYSTNGANGIYELGDLRHTEFLEREVELGSDIELIFDEHGDRPGEELSRERFPLPDYCPDRHIHVIFGCRTNSEGWHVLSFETS